MTTRQAARKLHIGWRALYQFIANLDVAAPLDGCSDDVLVRAAVQVQAAIDRDNAARDLAREAI